MSNLYLISTPIGNLEDLSFRALRILRDEVDVIFCEDTRVTRKLLSHYEIEGKKLISFNKDNETKRIAEILKYLDQIDLAIVSDAGTPLISDPGAKLIQAVQGEAHELIPVPGASALTAALSVCPIDCSRFVFEGFLPHGPKQRRRVLKHLVDESRPIVFFESPHRLMKCLKDIEAILDPSQIFIARELSKKFEQHYFGTLVDVQKQLREQFPKELKGEFVIVVDKVQIN